MRPRGATRCAGAAALAALALGATAAAAPAATQPVNVLFADFSPTPLDVLPGETVEWSNISERRHTVTASDGSFESGDDFQPGNRFSQTFTAVGAYPYHCRIHPGMVGEVDVRRVTLDTLPPAAVPAGNAVEFTGRTAEPGSPVTIERDTGGGFKPVGTATPTSDGRWKTLLTAQTTGDYRVSLGADTSEARRLLVSDRKLLVRATRKGVTVTAVPAAPYARIVLQLDLRERFGWWPAAFSQLDYVSSAVFDVASPARVRVVMVDKDGWTAIATSPELTLGHVRRMPKHHMH